MARHSITDAFTLKGTGAGQDLVASRGVVGYRNPSRSPVPLREPRTQEHWN